MSKFYTYGTVLPYVPTNTARARLVRDQGVFRANLQTQVRDRQSWRWQFDYNYTHLNDTDKLAMHAFLARAQGQYMPLIVPDLTTPTPVGSYEDNGFFYSDYDDAEPIFDPDNWAIDNTSVARVHAEPRAIRFTSKRTNVATECVFSYLNGFAVNSNDTYTIRVAVRGVGMANIGANNFKLRFGANPGSVSPNVYQIHSDGYHTMPLDVSTVNTMYPSILFNTQSMREGDAVIIDRLEVFRGTAVTSWINRGQLWLSGLPSVGRLQAGSRVELNATLLTLTEGTIETFADNALMQVQPGVPTSFAPTDSYQMCPYLPHGRFILDSPEAYEWTTNAVNYDSFNLKFLGANQV